MKRHFVKEYTTTKTYRFTLDTTYCGKELNFRFNGEAQIKDDITCKTCLNALKKEHYSKCPYVICDDPHCENKEK